MNVEQIHTIVKLDPHFVFEVKLEMFSKLKKQRKNIWGESMPRKRTRKERENCKAANE